MAEVVIEQVSRALSWFFAWVGLAGSLVVICLYFTTLPGVEIDLDIRILALGLAVGVASVFSLYSLASDKPFLETSDDGVMAGSMVRWYCPWANIRDIAVMSVERDMGKGLLLSSSKITVRQLVIELHSVDELLFDNRFHATMSGYVVKDGRIILDIAGKTAMSCEKLCGLLRERWRQAVASQEKSRA
ncbi:hypothetical protein LF599_11350 [Pseudodesulfovibrio thermohalotolerans]|uniref:hypothetical protein n=1 Tax=Pseudodesulfovibrio thermohalotolerans TaxID=2880651 RepID=UPI0024413069|nr:hypothetical protein [Pseudodesulfovibrio thermohalotolerans]WFS61270.1 hypothetical protein LF599_11350 [Pseudodesulfovibrio thermohalotolerans]